MGVPSEIELTLITPEQEPLGIFGMQASAAIRGLLDQAGVTLYTSSFGEPAGHGWLEVTPGDRRMQVDRVVTAVAPGRPATARSSLRPGRVHPN